MNRPVNIKDVIETISHIFHHHGLSKVTAEVFRQAKFNKSDAAIHMFNLILEVISLETTLISSDTLSDRLPDRLFLLVYILNKLKYPRLLYFLKNDESELSSRELLLALGFLLVRLDVLAKLRHKAENYLAEIIVSIDVDKQSPSLYPTTATTTIKTTTTIEEDLNRLIVLRKKVDFLFRGLYSSIDMYGKILKKCDKNKDLILNELNENAIKLKYRHVSLIDILLQGNLKLQQQLLRSLREQDVLLKLHLKWMKNQAVFWRWMTSVAQEASLTHDTNYHRTREGNPLDKLRLNLLLSGDVYFANMYHRYCGEVDDNNVMADLRRFPMKQFLCNALSKSVTYFNQRQADGGNDKVMEEIENLTTRIRLLEQENKLWLSKYLAVNHPGLVEMPLPRR